ncbi:hypothetical protein EKO04_000878 [Ascochyta lentis]|uniref:GRF-like zinc ribbon domain-containing protein n=1 Tax=Ascochyta lentis TaxID=205686 RepID=A0A8H7JDY5_9PLEO|nr:hypothetical protein EKO04_000878 [Ascochyta lentis]
MGLFSRKKPPAIINNYHNTYQQTTATAVVAAPIPAARPRLAACRNCYSAQRTQLLVTKWGANAGREYYICIGCPAEGSGGKSWIVWADQLVS